MIDPVDGTYNFLHGSTYWCSAIALKDSSDVLLGAIFQPEEDKLWLGGTARAATLNGEAADRLPGPDGARTAARDARSRRTRRGHLHPPTWLADPMCAMPWHAAATSAATLRMFGSGSCDLGRVADGAAGLLVPAQLPGMGLAAREGDRPRRRRRHGQRPGQRPGMVHGGRHDGGAPVACGPRVRLRGLAPAASRSPGQGSTVLSTGRNECQPHRLDL